MKYKPTRQLVELSPIGKFIFVGDTHGDLDTSRQVIDKYLKPNNRLVFLGDYVDRGPYSKKNIDFLLEERQKHPRKVYLLQGNHEGKMISDIHPCDFWDSLKIEDLLKYAGIFARMPLALSVGDILAVHASVPELGKLKDFNKIKNGDQSWDDCVWRDLIEDSEDGMFRQRRYYLGPEFNKRMASTGKNLLIRAHDPFAPESMYDGKCLTLFTSCAYHRNKTIAIADFTNGNKIRNVEDLIIEEI